jgi:glycosidase
MTNHFTQINETYGSIEEFGKFLNYSKSKDIKILIDFIPNYTTDEHEWFRASLIDTKYRDYYVWSKEPNNWVNKNSIFSH